MVWLCYLNFTKGLTDVYTIKLFKRKNDRPNGIVSNNVCIIVSMLFSLSVQLVNVKIS